MGLFRLLNPFVVNPTAPRHRTARALETLAKAQRESDRRERAASAVRAPAPRAAPAAPERPATAAGLQLVADVAQVRADKASLLERRDELSSDEITAGLAAISARISEINARAHDLS